MYYINWNNGLKNEFNGTINEAKEYADERINYTQANVTIENEKEEKIYIRKWYGTKASEEDKERNIIEYGNFGFYDEWIEI